MDNKTLWRLSNGALTQLHHCYRPSLERLCADEGLDSVTWGLLVAADTFQPAAVSAARLRAWGPYTAPESYLDRLAAAAARGYLEEVDRGRFRLTDAGRGLVRRSVTEVREVMTEADPMPSARTERLADLLACLVEAGLAAPPPPEPRSLEMSARLMPDRKPPLPYVEQALSCLAAYRDDAHLAAWQPSGLSATALETLTLLWTGQAAALEAICQQLAYRGHSPKVYARALEELRGRGFIQGPDHAPQVTETGQHFRNAVEADTDRFFFAPWSCLDGAEKEELGSLLTYLCDGLEDS